VVVVSAVCQDGGTGKRRYKKSVPKENDNQQKVRRFPCFLPETWLRFSLCYTGIERRRSDFSRNRKFPGGSLVRSAAKLACITLVSVTWTTQAALAQPLVTGGLTLYYDFDEIVGNEFLDESGNGFNGAINVGDPGDITPGTLTLETVNAKRGAGAANFSQSTNVADLPVYVDVDGANITTNFPGQLPSTAITIAAWVNVTSNNTVQSVFQARTSSGGHGVPHFQLNASGRLRMTFRDQTGNDVAQSIVYTNGDAMSGPSYPVNEWFHYAGTYDMATNVFAQYYNGVQIAMGSGTPALLGDWGGQLSGPAPNFFAAGIGAIYDSGERRFDGLMDDFYIFNRALEATEVQTLFTGLTADFDNDKDVDGADFLKWQADFGTSTNADDLLNWESQYGEVSDTLEALGAATAVVPEPSTFALATFVGLALASSRRKRRC